MAIHFIAASKTCTLKMEYLAGSIILVLFEHILFL
jgi:hypothetical protein